MTLSEIATMVTTKLSDTDSASVAACKTYINARYRMAWDSAIWTETLGIASKAVAAGDTTITLDAAPDITFYQSGSTPTTYIDFVVAAKFTPTSQDEGVEARAADWMSWFQLDPNAWADLTSRRSTITGYINLPRNSSGYCRIKPVPVPDAAGSMYVLGKLKFVSLGDSDSPALRGADNYLLAMAEGDMLERGRQYGKAQAKYQEGAAMLAVMRDIERGQQQLNSYIIPLEEGYIDPAGGPL